MVLFDFALIIAAPRSELSPNVFSAATSRPNSQSANEFNTEKQPGWGPTSSGGMSLRPCSDCPYREASVPPAAAPAWLCVDRTLARYKRRLRNNQAEVLQRNFGRAGDISPDHLSQGKPKMRQSQAEPIRRRRRKSLSLRSRAFGPSTRRIDSAPGSRTFLLTTTTFQDAPSRRGLCDRNL